MAHYYASQIEKQMWQIIPARGPYRLSSHEMIMKLILLVLCLSLRGSAFHLPFPPSSLISTSVLSVLKDSSPETISDTSSSTPLGLNEALNDIKHDNNDNTHATIVQSNPEQYLSRGVDEDFANKSFKLDNYGPLVEIGNKKVIETQ